MRELRDWLSAHSSGRDPWTGIGQGGGYYDRFLPATRALRVGVCHDFALLDEIPSEPHDARMDVIVTPSRTIFTAEEAIT